MPGTGVIRVPRRILATASAMARYSFSGSSGLARLHAIQMIIAHSLRVRHIRHVLMPNPSNCLRIASCRRCLIVLVAIFLVLLLWVSSCTMYQQDRFSASVYTGAATRHTQHTPP